MWETHSLGRVSHISQPCYRSHRSCPRCWNRRSVVGTIGAQHAEVLENGKETIMTEQSLILDRQADRGETRVLHAVDKTGVSWSFGRREFLTTAMGAAAATAVTGRPGTSVAAAKPEASSRPGAMISPACESPAENVLSLDSYSDVRAFGGCATSLLVYGHTSVGDGGAGLFLVDPNDSLSSDNDGTVLVDILDSHPCAGRTTVNENMLYLHRMVGAKVATTLVL